MQQPTSIREVHQLTSRLAVLSRFLSKLAELAHPFFKVLKKKTTFAWDEECQVAFDSLKDYLVSPIMLLRLELGEELQVYLATSDQAMSAVLCRTDPNGT